MLKASVILILGVLIGFLAGGPMKLVQKSQEQSCVAEKKLQSSAATAIGCEIPTKESFQITSLKTSGINKVGETAVSEDLMKYPLEDLRRAYEKKQKEFEDKTIYARFPALEKETERKERREMVYSRLNSVIEQSEFWIARTVIEVDKLKLPALFTLQFYSGIDWDGSKPKTPLFKAGAENVNWAVGAVIIHDQKSNYYGGSATMSEINVSGGDLVTTLYSHSDFRSIVPYFVVGLPVGSNASAPFEIFDLKDSGKWKKQPRLEWQAVTREESQQAQKDFSIKENQ